MGGHVKRVGVYSLSGDIDLKQAIIAAGMLDKEGPMYVQLIRRENGEETYPVVNAEIDPDFRNPQLRIFLEKDDQVFVLDHKAPTTQPGRDR
jgi:hypothetical protein